MFATCVHAQNDVGRKCLCLGDSRLVQNGKVGEIVDTAVIAKTAEISENARDTEIEEITDTEEMAKITGINAAAEIVEMTENSKVSLSPTIAKTADNNLNAYIAY